MLEESLSGQPGIQFFLCKQMLVAGTSTFICMESFDTPGMHPKPRHDIYARIYAFISAPVS